LLFPKNLEGIYMKKIAIAPTLAFMFSSTLFAEPNLQKNPEGLKN